MKKETSHILILAFVGILLFGITFSFGYLSGGITGAAEAMDAKERVKAFLAKAQDPNTEYASKGALTTIGGQKIPDYVVGKIVPPQAQKADRIESLPRLVAILRRVGNCELKFYILEKGGWGLYGVSVPIVEIQPQELKWKVELTEQVKDQLKELDASPDITLVAPAVLICQEKLDCSTGCPDRSRCVNNECVPPQELIWDISELLGLLS